MLNDVNSISACCADVIYNFYIVDTHRTGNLHYRTPLMDSTELHYVRGWPYLRAVAHALRLNEATFKQQSRKTHRQQFLGNQRSRSSMPPPPSYRTVFMFCLAACRVMDTAAYGSIGKKLALIHDDGLDLLRPRSHTELWMTKVLDDARHLRCPSSISFATFRMSVDLAMITQHDLVGGRRLFDGLVLAATGCRVADVLEPILSSTTPLLRLEFVPCSSAATSGGLEIERLELYRLDEASRDYCGLYVFNKWLEHRICSSSMDATSRRLLLDSNEAPFNVSRELQECSNLDDHQWTRSIRPFRLELAESVSRQQFNGNKLRLASLERPPFVIFERSNGTITGFKGYCYEIIHALQKIYNFTYEVEQPSDNTYGTEMPNGSWNGMIGMITEHVVDIGVGPFSVTHSRSKAIDFSVAFYEEPTAILIPPPAEDNRLLACIKPFRLEVWLSLILFAIFLPIILWKDLTCVWKIYQKAAPVTQNGNSIEKLCQEKRPVLAKQYFFILGVLIGQSGQKLSSIGFSPRFIGAFWCLSTVVFASAYVGILFGFLSFPRLSAIIGKLEELPGSKLEWGVHRGTALETLFTEATTGVYKTIGEGLLKPGALVDVNADGIQRVTNGSYAFIKEKSYLEFAVDEDYARLGTCRLSIAKQEFFKVNFAFALPTASPLKQLLDKKILQLIETGLGEYWKKIHWPPLSRKCDDIKRSEGPKSLSLTDLQGAFLILALGSGMASVIFVAERFITRFS